MMAHISVARKWGAHDNGCVLVWLSRRSGVGRVDVCPPISMPECPLWLLDIQGTPDGSPRAEAPPGRGLRPALLQPALPWYLTSQPPFISLVKLPDTPEGLRRQAGLLQPEAACSAI